MITDCKFCHKALEMQRSLDIAIISERNRFNDLIKAHEHEKRLFADRLSHAELGYINFIEFLLSYYEATDEQEEFFMKKLEYFNNKATKEALKIDKPII